MIFGDGRGRSKSQVNTAITNGYRLNPFSLAATAPTYSLTANITGYSTYFTSVPTGWSSLAIYEDSNGNFSTNLNFADRLPSGFASYTVTYVDSSRANDSGAGTSPDTAKKNIGPLLTDATDRILVVRGPSVDLTTEIRRGNWGALRTALKSGLAFDNSQSAGGTDTGANKIIVPWFWDQQILLTGFYSFADMTWTIDNTNSLWTSNTVTSTAGGILDFGQSDSFGQPLRVMTATTTVVSITGVSGAGVITATSHGLTTGDKVVLYSIGGISNMSGTFTATVIDANTFNVGVTPSGSYISGGSVVSLMPILAATPRCATINSVQYYNNGSTTTAPGAANTFVSVGSSRYKHNTPGRALNCMNCWFLGQTIAFSSVCGQNIVSVTNNAGNCRITTSAAHGFTNGQTITIEGVGSPPAGLNAAHVISNASGTVFDVSIAFAGSPTANTGIANNMATALQETFENGGFGFNFNSTTGANVAEFAGNGYTTFKNCTFFGSSADVVDYRTRRFAVEDRCWFRGAGHQNQASVLSQCSTAHGGARIISVNSDYGGSYGPTIQDVRENNVDSYRIMLGCWMSDSKSSTSATKVGFFSGTGSATTDATIIWSINSKYAAPDGSNPLVTYYTVNHGSGVYINQAVLAALKVTQGTPAFDSYTLS